MPIGLQPYNYQPAYGGIPTLTNPTTTASSAISGNLANLPQLQGLVSGINPQYTRQQDIIGQELAGQVPQDVVNQLAQQAAERGIAIGSPGSPNTLANYLTRFLGTSYGIQRQGMSEANTLGQLTEEMMRPYMVSAADQQAAEAMQSIYNAAPVPSEAAKAAEDAIRRAYDLYGRDMIAGAGGAGGRPGYAIGPTPYSGRPQPFTGAINYPQVAMGSTPGAYQPNSPTHAGQLFNAMSGTWYNPATASGPQTTPLGGDVPISNYVANLGTGGGAYDPSGFLSGNVTGVPEVGLGYGWPGYGLGEASGGYNLGAMAGLTSPGMSPPFLGSMAGWGGTPYSPAGTTVQDPYYALDLFSPEWKNYMGFEDSGGYYADAGGGE